MGLRDDALRTAEFGRGDALIFVEVNSIIVDDTISL
jgi:hypothetical protein